MQVCLPPVDLATRINFRCATASSRLRLWRSGMQCTYPKVITRCQLQPCIPPRRALFPNGPPPPQLSVRRADRRWNRGRTPISAPASPSTVTSRSAPAATTLPSCRSPRPSRAAPNGSPTRCGASSAAQPEAGDNCGSTAGCDRSVGNHPRGCIRRWPTATTMTTKKAAHAADAADESDERP